MERWGVEIRVEVITRNDQSEEELKSERVFWSEEEMESEMKSV
jgi:hypothetical protein